MQHHKKPNSGIVRDLLYYFTDSFNLLLVLKASKGIFTTLLSFSVGFSPLQRDKICFHPI